MKAWLTPSRYAGYSGDAYSFQSVIGKGAFGLVTLVDNVQTGHRCAMKTIDRFRLHNARLRKAVRYEVQILRLLSRHRDCVFIANLMEVIETPRSIHIVLAYGGKSVCSFCADAAS